MIKKFALSLVLVSSTVVAESRCRPKNGEPIIIGCSYKCDFIYRIRLLIAAISQGYSLEVVNMRELGDQSAVMSYVDGILIPGGADIDPEFYLPNVSPELQKYTRENIHMVKFSKQGKFRDFYEHSMLKSYSEEEKFEKLPLLGICRGMQMMSVAQGIPLYLDLKKELGIRNRKAVFDHILIRRDMHDDSLISTLFKGNNITGFKSHHQGLRVPYFLEHQSNYPEVRVTATSHNGRIAEAIEYTHRPALGVQYHPEKSFSGAALPIFNWFFTKACEYKNSHKDTL